MDKSESDEGSGDASPLLVAVDMFRDGEGRIRSLSRDEYERLITELPQHLADMTQFSVATGLRQANVTTCSGSRSAWSAAICGFPVATTKTAGRILCR